MTAGPPASAVPAAAASSGRELAERFGLSRLGGRPPLGRYLGHLWERRHFTYELARSRFAAETQQDRLGLAWIVIRPLINAVVYGVIFAWLLRVGRVENFVAFLVAGVFAFQFFSGSLSNGARSITSNLGLVRALHFPRAVLPVATVLKEVFALAPMIAVLAVLVLATGEPLRPAWLLAVPALALMAMFNLGVAFVAARLTIHVRDLAQLIPFLVRVMFYLSGVFFAVDRLPAAAPVRALLQANPVHIYLTLVRGAFLDHLPAPVWMWVAGAAWAVGTLGLGFVFFWRAEERYGRA